MALLSRAILLERWALQYRLNHNLYSCHLVFLIVVTADLLKNPEIYMLFNDLWFIDKKQTSVRAAL